MSIRSSKPSERKKIEKKIFVCLKILQQRKYREASPASPKMTYLIVITAIAHLFVCETMFVNSMTGEIPQFFVPPSISSFQETITDCYRWACFALEFLRFTLDCVAKRLDSETK